MHTLFLIVKIAYMTPVDNPVVYSLFIFYWVQYFSESNYNIIYYIPPKKRYVENLRNECDLRFFIIIDTINIRLWLCGVEIHTF